MEAEEYQRYIRQKQEETERRAKAAYDEAEQLARWTDQLENETLSKLI